MLMTHDPLHYQILLCRMENGHGVIIQSGPTVHGPQVMVYGPCLGTIFFLIEHGSWKNTVPLINYYLLFISLGQSNDDFQKHVAFNFDKLGRWNNENKHSEKEFLCQYTGEDKKF